jgi:hypothetical protein
MGRHITGPTPESADGPRYRFGPTPESADPGIRNQTLGKPSQNGFAGDQIGLRVCPLSLLS